MTERVPEHCRDTQGCWVGGREEVERVMKDNGYCVDTLFSCFLLGFLEQYVIQLRSCPSIERRCTAIAP